MELTSARVLTLTSPLTYIVDSLNGVYEVVFAVVVVIVVVGLNVVVVQGVVVILVVVILDVTADVVVFTVSEFGIIVVATVDVIGQLVVVVKVEVVIDEIVVVVVISLSELWTFPQDAKINAMVKTVNSFINFFILIPLPKSVRLLTY